jgi:Tfp pilus assembly protein PilO
MSRSFDLRNLQWKDPRIAIRVILGVLLLANLAAAVVAFKPFGGGADDLRREQKRLQQQYAQLQAQVAHAKRLAAKVQTARTEGDQFLDDYVTDRRVVTSTIQGELYKLAKEAGVTFLPGTWNPEPIEGSDTLQKMAINTNFQGTYANLAKFINLVDKSDRFLIIESLNATPVQSGQVLTVAFKIDTFIKERPGDVE